MGRHAPTTPNRHRRHRLGNHSLPLPRLYQLRQGLPRLRPVPRIPILHLQQTSLWRMPARDLSQPWDRWRVLPFIRQLSRGIHVRALLLFHHIHPKVVDVLIRFTIQRKYFQCVGLIGLMFQICTFDNAGSEFC